MAASVNDATDGLINIDSRWCDVWLGSLIILLNLILWF